MEGNRVRVCGRRVNIGVTTGEEVMKYEVKVSGIRTHGVCLCDEIYKALQLATQMAPCDVTNVL